MGNSERSKKLNRILKAINHATIIVCIVGFALIITLMESPFSRKVDLELPRMSLDELFQEAKNTALEMGYQLQSEDTEKALAEFVKLETAASSKLRIEAEAIEEYQTGSKHLWIKVKIENVGIASKFTLDSPEETNKKFFEILNRRLMEFI